jgi:hypothetical protein
MVWTLLAGPDPQFADGERSPVSQRNPIMTRSLAVRTAAALSIALFVWSARAESPGDVLVRGRRGPAVRLGRRAHAHPRRAAARVRHWKPAARADDAEQLLVNCTLAERARAQGIDKDPIVQRRLEVEAERVLASLMVERIEAEAGAAFDRATERNLARARELYLVNRAKYTVPEEIDASHILFDTSSEVRRRSQPRKRRAPNCSRARTSPNWRLPYPTIAPSRATRAGSAGIREADSIRRSKLPRSCSGIRGTSASPC